jgi:hypothetical protein
MKFAVVFLCIVSIAYAQCSAVNRDGSALQGAASAVPADTANTLQVVAEAVANVDAIAKGTAEVETKSGAFATTQVGSDKCVYGNATSLSGAMASSLAEATAKASASANAIAKAHASAWSYIAALAVVSAESCSCQGASRFLQGVSAFQNEVTSQTSTINGASIDLHRKLRKVADVAVKVYSVASAKAGPTCAGCGK